jgi:hypothetical protein
MTTLTDQEVTSIAKKVARANKVSLDAVSIATAVASTGEPAVEIKLVLTPGSSTAIMGKPAAMIVSELIRELADSGEERPPIVRYADKGVAGS